MSTKHKKKKHVSAKQLAQLRVEYKKHFFNRIKDICALVDGEELFELIPQKELERIYDRRGLPFKTVAAPGEVIPKEILKYISSFLNHGVRDTNCIIAGNGASLTIFEMFTIGITFLHYLSELPEDEFVNAEKVKQLSGKFIPFEKVYEEAYQTFASSMNVAGFMESDLTSKIYWLDHNYAVKNLRSIGIENVVQVHSYIPPKIHIGKEEDKSRPALKVCIGLSVNGVYHSVVKSSLLGVNSSIEEYDIDVYIQMHAIHRLRERLDCLDTVGIFLWLYHSLKSAKIHKEDETNYLIEYRIDCISVGYLASEFLDGNLIIKTFLFITQAGTPEGKKLKELYGLGRLDISYIEMDKLSTYIYNDLCVNRELSEIFQQAGCQYLLDIFTDSRIKPMCHDQKNNSRVDLMMKYMGISSNSDLLKEGRR